jgi:hypothetical protein
MVDRYARVSVKLAQSPPDATPRRVNKRVTVSADAEHMRYCGAAGYRRAPGGGADEEGMAWLKIGCHVTSALAIIPLRLHW